MEQPIRAWHIGEYGEVFAGRCTDEEMKQWFREQVSVGDDYSEADEQIDDCFEEIPQDELDVIHKWDNGERDSSYRQEAERCVELPCQISTTYN